MFEGAAAVLGILLLVWLLSDSDKPNDEEGRYWVVDTEDQRFCEVQDSLGNTVYVGTPQQCDQWISDHP